jgi:Xaa-Pro aminopeptidase
MAMPTMRDADRVARIQAALQAAELDALVCTLPSNVLLISGYWPVIGTSIAVASRDGAIGLLVPDDEQELAARSRADLLETFVPGPLDALPPLLDVVREPLARMFKRLHLGGGRVGCERGPMLEPSSYAGTTRYLATMPALLQTTSGTSPINATELLLDLRAVLTPGELVRLRLACRVARDMYQAGAAGIVPGTTERDVAGGFRAALESAAVEEDEALERAGGFVFCMSGPNAALAYRAYARTRQRRIADADMVMVHCNSFVDGFWTDITRTFHVRSGDGRAGELFDAVLAARHAALASIRPGARGREVDQAARQVLAERGWGPQFKHGTGHGVGFAAIDHSARPRIHPASDDVLEVGMVFNVEPAVYLEGWGGLRHCDMVAVTSEGAELLTPFQSSLHELAPWLLV